LASGRFALRFCADTGSFMLILLAPDFDTSPSSYQRLAELTGLVVYDLKNRVRTGSWSLLKTLGDLAEATELANTLRGNGFHACLVDSEFAHDPQRKIVKLDALELKPDHLVLFLQGRAMDIPYQALLTIVRGEVRLGRHQPRSGSSSSSSMRALAPSAAEVAVFRETFNAGTEEAFAGADLHFHTVLWAARIDSRGFDFSLLPEPTGNLAEDLRRLTELIADRAGVRIDESIRKSSLASFAGRPPPMRSMSLPPGATHRIEEKDDFQFSAYSRLVAEAERQTKPKLAAI